MTIYEQLKAAGVPLDSHESDLYALVTPESRAIVEASTHSRSTFVSQIDKRRWYDLPFAFDPFWEKVWERSQKIETARRKREDIKAG